MVITGEAALQIFKKWRDEKTVVFCKSSLFSCWGMAMQGRVIDVDRDDVVRFDCLNRPASLTLTISGAEGFEYGEPEHAPESIRSLAPPEARQTSFLLVALPLRAGQPTLARDKLAFAELTAGTKAE